MLRLKAGGWLAPGRPRARPGGRRPHRAGRPAGGGGRAAGRRPAAGPPARPAAARAARGAAARRSCSRRSPTPGWPSPPTPRRCSAPTSPHRPCPTTRPRASSAWPHVAAAQILYYERPPQIVRGLRQWLYGADGRAYLDAVNNVAVLGHSHPAVAEAAAPPAAPPQHELALPLPLHRPRYAERLAALLPEGARAPCSWSLSGSEANDLALRIAPRGRRAAPTSLALARRLPRLDGRDRTRISHRAVRQPARRRAAAGLGAPRRAARPLPRRAPRRRRRPRATRTTCAPGCAAWPPPAAAPPPSSASRCSATQGGVERPTATSPQPTTPSRAAGGVCIADEVQVGLGRARRALLGLRARGRRPRHRRRSPSRRGTATRSAPSSPRRRSRTRFGRDAPCFSSMGGGADLLRGRPGGARRDRGRAAAGERAGRRHPPARAPARRWSAGTSWSARRTASASTWAWSSSATARRSSRRRRRRRPSASGCASGARSCSRPGIT